MELIYKGAEAELYDTDFDGRPAVLKRRIEKPYKDHTLDQSLRASRTKKEARMLERAGKFVKTPKVLRVDTDAQEIVLERIDGKRLKELFFEGDDATVADAAKRAGAEVARLHSGGFIHNDLTTSNMILAADGLYFIDFGLGFNSESVEDKAVDAIVFKKMLKSTHYERFDLIWKAFLEGYAPSDELKTRIRTVEGRVKYAKER